MNKKLLVIIDYQNDFVDGTLGFTDSVNLYPLIKNKILEEEKNKTDIIFTKDTHDQDYVNTLEGKLLPIKHCIKGTNGHNLYRDLEGISKSHIVLEKNTFPCKDFYKVLENRFYEEIEIIGVVTDICVISNAVILKSIYPNSRIIVNSKLVASNNKEMESKAFDLIRNLHMDVI